MSDYVFTDSSDPKKFAGECTVCKARLELPLPQTIRSLSTTILAFCSEHEHPEFAEENEGDHP